MTKTLKNLVVAVVLLATAMPSWAYNTARDAFINAPQGLLLLLTRNDRLDMLDYYDSQLTTPVTNGLQGKSSIRSVDDKMMVINMTPSSTYTIAMLPGDVIALIRTIDTPAKDSNITFYSAADWTEYPSDKYFTAPALAQWLTKKGASDRDTVEAMVPFIMAEYTYDPASQTLTATNDLRTFLSEDVYDMIADDLAPSLKYTWNGKKFVAAQ